MSEYGKRTTPVVPKALSQEALERWRSRERELLSHHDAADANAGTAAPVAPPEAEAVPPAAAGDGTQKRRAVRHKTLIGGKVVFNDLMSVYDCAIRDLSDTGALVKINAPVQVPPVFILKFGNGQVRRCKVRRRIALELGVEFLD